ncbi:MAG: aspartate carbamoyltransferase regulatory subunit [Rikenellaceae bacterium]|jgi:aspartate carbamoyltransferase regulatory subunit|nr:aspartate carbamoyltransferase regulatory subunit [Rikenellaceae bacterium]
MTAEKQMKVKAIENGTTIDHIPSDSLFKIIAILDLDKVKEPITFGTNLESRRMSTKAIIKIDNHYLADEQIDKIAFVAPAARVNTIRDYQVVEKRNVEVPDRIAGIVKCVNPACITNHERIKTRFDVIKKGEKINLKCCYCEKITTQNNMEIIR